MIKPEDVKIEAWPPAPTGGMQIGRIPNGVKITHSESGISAICEQYRSQHKNRQGAMELLEKNIAEKRGVSN